MKRPMTKRLQKKMAKEVRNAQGRYPVVETRQKSDELTPKEMLKKYPQESARRKEAIVKSMAKEISIKKKAQNKNIGKRTTPGLVSSRDAPPAHIHAEGKRWIKTLVKQNVADRTVQIHKGFSIGRKK
jgi:hypothetical protein